MKLSFNCYENRLKLLSKLGLWYTLIISTIIFVFGTYTIFPFLLKDNSLLYNRLLASYLFISYMLNFILCYVKNSFIPISNSSEIKKLKIKSSDDQFLTSSSSDSREINNQSNKFSTIQSKAFNQSSSINQKIMPPSSFRPHFFQSHVCELCGIDAPPRSHHCIVCQRCVLVREHHCFLVGICIGKNNYKYFISLLFFLSIGSVYSAVNGYVYMVSFYPSPFSFSFSVFNYILPFTFLQCLLGYQDWFFFFLLFLLMATLCTSISCLFSFFFHLMLVLTGRTSFEYYTKLPVAKETYYKNFLSVFGAKWFLGIFCPLLYSSSKQYDVKKI